MNEIIEIRDPGIDQDAIRQRIASQVAERHAINAYDPDVAQKGPPSLLPHPTSAEAGASGQPGWNEILVTLMLNHRLSETEFTSETPVIGSLIVAARRFWNWMSTKWYLRPILRQQNGINAQLVLLLTELTQRHESLEQRLIEMQAELERLRTQENRVD